MNQLRQAHNPSTKLLTFDIRQLKPGKTNKCFKTDETRQHPGYKLSNPVPFQFIFTWIYGPHHIPQLTW